MSLSPSPSKLSLLLSKTAPKQKVGFIYIIHHPVMLPDHVKLGRTDDYFSLKGRYDTTLPGHQSYPFLVIDPVKAEHYLFELARVHHYRGEVYKLTLDQAMAYCLQTQLWDLSRHNRSIMKSEHQLNRPK